MTTFIILPRLFLLLAFLCAGSASVPSLTEKAIPQREASLTTPGAIDGSIVLRWSFGSKDFSKTKSALQAPAANLPRETTRAGFDRDELKVFYSPTLFGISPSRSPPARPTN